MKRKKAIIIIVSVFLVLTALVVFLVFLPKKSTYGDPVDLNKFDYYYKMVDSYGTKYEEEWLSTDGHILVTINNKKSIYGRGRYSGTYQANEKTYNIEMVIEGGIAYAEMYNPSSEPKNQLFYGIYTIDYFNDVLKIIVNNDFDDDDKMVDSIYKNGDEIIIKKTK